MEPVCNRVENCSPPIVDIVINVSIEKKFDPKKFTKLKKPERLDRENPELTWEKMSLKNDSTFIDIGCGVGFAAIPFAKKMTGGLVYACDLSEEMLAVLKSDLDETSIKNVKTIKMEEVSVPLPDAIADGALMQNLHHELDNAIDNLKECSRLLKPGGIVAVIDWKVMETPGGPPLEIRVDAKKIEKDMVDAGFDSIRSLDVFPYHSFVIAKKVR